MRTIRQICHEAPRADRVDVLNEPGSSDVYLLFTNADGNATMAIRTSAFAATILRLKVDSTLSWLAN